MKSLLLSLVVVLTTTAIGYSEQFSVMDFGAEGDAVTDNTAGFQAALNQAGSIGGGIVNIPTGRFRINGNLSIPGAVTLLGSFRVPPTDRHDGRPDMYGTVLMAYAGRGTPDAAPFIHLSNCMAALGGVIITYPEVSKSDVPPIPYPPAVAVLSFADNVGVFDTCFLNTYEAIRLVVAGRHYIRNVYGYPIWRGLYIDQCLDVGRVENVHFWPFGGSYSPDHPYDMWINTHGIAFEFARTDWQYVSNTFCFGYGVGYKFSGSDLTHKGGANGNFHGLGADSCAISVLVEDAQPYGLLFTNGEFVGRWISTESIGILVEEQVNAHINFTNCSFWGALDRAIWQKSNHADLKITNSNFLQYDTSLIDSPAIQIDGGRAIITANSFALSDKFAVKVAPETQSAIILGNQSPYGVKIDNQAGARTQMTANQPPPDPPTGTAVLSWLLDVGADGDEPFLWHWHGQEPFEAESDWETSKRWSGARSKFIVPVQPGVSYTAQINIMVPEHAYDSEGGIFLGDTRLLPLPNQAWYGTVSFTVPASDESTIELELRCQDWVPAEVIPGNMNLRRLGASVRMFRMTAEGVSGGYYHLNLREWVGAEIPPTSDQTAPNQQEQQQQEHKK